MIEFRIARGSSPTGKLIAGMLQAKGIELNIRDYGKRGVRGEADGDAIINWGINGSDGRPTLNEHADGSKYKQLVELAQAGIPCPAVLPLPNLFFPSLLRKDRHSGGTDIIVLRGMEDWRKVSERKRAFYAYSTELIESDREFRVWVWRTRALVVYEKLKKREADRPGFGRNYAQGYGFNKLEDPDNALCDVGIAAVKALNLDFGAVDVMHGLDGKYYVLEVNTAPRIAHERRTCGLRLVRRIEKWIQNGFVARQ